MDEMIKKLSLQTLSGEELNKVRGGSPPRMIIPPLDPDSEG
jgi:hypothetical protein